MRLYCSVSAFFVEGEGVTGRDLFGFQKMDMLVQTATKQDEKCQ